MYFVLLLQYGNITKSAEILFVSQPAITKSIQTLENQLETKLFTRTKDGVKLTEDGKILYSNLKQGLDIIHNAENKLYELKNLEYGKIRIGASSTVTKYFLIPYLKKFHELYPNVDIQIINHLTQNLLNELKNGNLDILILNLPTKASNDIKIIPCKQVTDCFLVSNEYIDNVPNIINLSDLNNYPLILQKSPSNTRTFIDNFMLDNKIILKPKIEVVSYGIVLELTKIGLGIGYATEEFAKSDLESGRLIKIQTNPKLPSRQLGIAIMDNNYESFATKKLISIILE